MKFARPMNHSPYFCFVYYSRIACALYVPIIRNFYEIINIVAGKVLKNTVNYSSFLMREKSNESFIVFYSNSSFYTFF